jgi:putative phosphoribosyl transferase
MFKDRADAGTKLGKALSNYKDKDALVLGIPRGGVETAYYVAKSINAELSVIVSRKLPFPDNPEAGFGAITEDGSTFIFPHFKNYLPDNLVKRIIEQQKIELERRIKVFRGLEPLPPMQSRTVIIVDDGIAMGSTMRAAVILCRNKSAEKIIVASPVAAPETVEEFKKIADDVVILETPEYFQAVAQVYLNWYDLSDEEVLSILRRWKEARH